MLDPITATRLAWLNVRFWCAMARFRVRLFLARPRATVVMYRMDHAKDPEHFFTLLVDASIAEGESLTDMRRDAALTAQRLQPFMSLKWPDLDPPTAETILRRAIQRKLRERGA